MQRHLLLKRQRQMLRGFSPRLPLVRRIIRQQRLLAARLGLPAAFAGETPGDGPLQTPLRGFVPAAISDQALPGDHPSATGLLQGGPVEAPAPHPAVSLLLPAHAAETTHTPVAGSVPGQEGASPPGAETLHTPVAGSAPGQVDAPSPGQAAQATDPVPEPIPGQGLSRPGTPQAEPPFAQVATTAQPALPAGQADPVAPPAPLRQGWELPETGEVVVETAHPARPALHSRVEELPAGYKASGGEDEGQGGPAKQRPHTDPAAGTGGQQSSAGNAETLFAPRATDRSPQAWLARLTRQAQQEQRQAHRRPEPVSQRARAVLRPLLGIDPGEVPIYRDAQAAQATSDLGADALSVDTHIELAPGTGAETPETLGLLAHELTHTARRQQPRFIPPVAQVHTRAGDGSPAPEMLDEEKLALRVERQVRRAATGQSGASVTAHGMQRGGDSPGTRGIWGNLPAPWEPLPAWLTSASAFSGPGASPPATPLAPPSPPAQAPPVTWQAPAEADTRRAGRERSVGDTDEEGASVQDAPEHTPTQEPEQDLDDLARQVYNVLKRRLGVEQRRGA